MARFRPLVLVGTVIILLGCALAAVAGLAFNGIQRAADYPGALLVSSHSIHAFSPELTVRTDSSYRTNDKFPIVYHWYSHRFDLGPEAGAHSACIIMERTSKSLGIVERSVGVTLCDTVNGRLIFVQRTFAVRYPH